MAIAVAESFIIPYGGYPLIYPSVRSVELKSEVPIVAPLPAVTYPLYRYGYGHDLPAAHLRVDKTPLEHSYEFVTHGW